MYTSRPLVRAPTVYRVVRAPASRNMSIFSPSPVFPRFQQPSFPSFNHGFDDLFRMMDEFAAVARPSFDHFQLRAAAPTFQPRFDVREQDGVYELRGELPGVKGSDLEVEFTDARTLVIRGKTEQESTRGNLSAATQAQTTAAAIEPAQQSTMSGALESQQLQDTTTANAVAVDNDDAASVKSNSSYQKPSVEDEDATANAANEVRSLPSSGRATPAGSVDGDAAEAAQTQTVAATATSSPPSRAPAQSPQQQQVQSEAQQQQQQQQQQQSHYYISERSVGSFQRVFQFPTKIEHDAVKASLKDGLLVMSIPKARKEVLRRIRVE